MSRRFQQVDVFSSGAFTGNPLAVVLDADGLSSGDMLRFTRWMNLSEAAFLLPPTSPDADYRVRIFTAARELPFAGHPTLGSCHAWLATGHGPRMPGRIVQECGAGLVSVRKDRDGLAFAAPPLLREGPVEDALLNELTSILGIERDDIVDAQWVDNGPGWVGLLLKDADAVLALDPDFGRQTSAGSLDIGLVGPYPAGSPCGFEVRAVFSGAHGEMVEDPATGSLNASLAQWLIAAGHATAPYIASQGRRLGREALIRIDRDPQNRIWIGGNTTTRIEGTIEF